VERHCGCLFFFFPSVLLFSDHTCGFFSMTAPWVLAEAYKYRRLRECFSLSKYWVEYGLSSSLSFPIVDVRNLTLDPHLFMPYLTSPRLASPRLHPDVFFRQKCDTFARSSDAVFELASRFAAPFKFPENVGQDEKLTIKKTLFRELTQGESRGLWGKGLGSISDD
jgi:hypothetical protein